YDFREAAYPGTDKFVFRVILKKECVKDSINKLSKQQNEIAEVKIIIEDQNTSVRQQKRIGIDENNLNEEFNKLRHELITTVFYESRFAARGNDLNEKYEHQLYIIDQHEKLTVAEKVETKRRITFDKDFRNLLFLKGPKYKCALCGRSGYTNYTCEHCSRDVLKSEFVNWSSGNEVIDEAIRKSQMILPLPGWIQEWIPFSELENMKYKTRGGCATIYTAIWTKGYMKEFDNEKRTFGRSGPYKVIMKRLEGSSIADTKYFKELTLHLTLRGHGCQVVHCCGVTRDPESDDFMLVMVEMESDLGIRPTIPPDLPDTLKYLMEQCWDNNPEARPTSAKLHEYFSEKYKLSFDNCDFDPSVVRRNLKLKPLLKSSGSKLHDFGDLLRNCNVTKSNMGSNQQSSYETIQDKLAISVESVTSDSSVV
ncbi:15305_t:CDS:2, partial [Rhizophagus irregularis]